MNATPESMNTVDAMAVVVEMLPAPAERKWLLSRLLDSADFADSIAPNAWGVTLFRNGFRLNVGQVEALVFIDGKIRVNFVGRNGIGTFAGESFADADYRTLPQPLCTFAGMIAAAAALPPSVWSSHAQFIKFAATTRTGQPRRGTPFRRSHCEALIHYARGATADAAPPPPSQALQRIEASSQVEYFDIETQKAREGYDVDRHILAWGRNARLATRRKAMDGYTCQACRFKLLFEGRYIIEVHHIDPPSATGEIVTTIDQLVSLCPTCHRIAHLRSTPYPVEKIREILGHQQTGK